MANEKKYTDNQIKWLKRYLDRETQSMRRAVDKVEDTNVAKFEAQNEWRQQFKDQTSTFVTRRELWGAVLAIVSIIIGVVAIVLKK